MARGAVRGPRAVSSIRGLAGAQARVAAWHRRDQSHTIHGRRGARRSGARGFNSRHLHHFINDLRNSSQIPLKEGDTESSFRQKTEIAQVGISGGFWRPDPGDHQPLSGSDHGLSFRVTIPARLAGSRQLPRKRGRNSKIRESSTTAKSIFFSAPPNVTTRFQLSRFSTAPA